MTIIYFASSEISVIRNEILHYLRDQKEKFPNYRVVDVGGGANSWADEYVDAYIDIKEFETEKQLFVGNICEPQIWNQVAESIEKFDFSICTHVFEDVRDPLFVAKGLMTISKAGFISMPNKHTEFWNIESPAYLGYCHHRWIFTIKENGDKSYLSAIAKFPIVNYWNTTINPFSNILHLFGKNNLMAKVNRRIGFIPGVSGIDWINPSMVGRGKELGFRWEDNFEFKIINNDFAGTSSIELANLYVSSLKEGI